MEAVVPTPRRSAEAVGADTERARTTLGPRLLSWFRTGNPARSQQLVAGSLPAVGSTTASGLDADMRWTSSTMVTLCHTRASLEMETRYPFTLQPPPPTTPAACSTRARTGGGRSAGRPEMRCSGVPEMNADTVANRRHPRMCPITAAQRLTSTYWGSRYTTIWAFRTDCSGWSRFSRLLACCMLAAPVVWKRLSRACVRRSMTRVVSMAGGWWSLEHPPFEGSNVALWGTYHADGTWYPPPNPCTYIPNRSTR